MPEKKRQENLRPWQFPASIIFGPVKSGDAQQVRDMSRLWPLE
jgi:hypothetical protein